MTRSRNRCYYCHSTTRELRPYGPGGALVCHPCGTSPAHAAEAVRQFADALARPTGLVILTQRGRR